MRFLSELERSLNAAAQRFNAEGGLIQAAVHLIKATDQVRVQYGKGHQSRVSTDRLDRIVEKLSGRDPILLSRGDRFVLAHSMSQPVARLSGRSVLESESIANAPIELWEQEAATGKISAAHWRGLFSGFLQAGPADTTERIRTILWKSWRDISAGKAFKMPWKEAVARHLCLLGKDPCTPYVTELLRGERGLLDDLREYLPPPPGSWFWVELRSALLRQIKDAEDDQFKKRLPFALEMAKDIPNYRDTVLAALLDRYARCKDKSPHAALLKFALDEWKSPQLTRHALWGQVLLTTKQMVCGWLAQEDLEDFYRLCQDAGQVDERRLKFWLRYKEQITFSQIVLGGDLMSSRNPDIREFRERKKGRLATLMRSTGGNNAIIMQIGDWVLVEFSQTGNACYPYLLDKIPFDIGQSQYMLLALKDKSASAASKATTLVHRESWETDTFEPFLRARGISPDGKTQTPRSSGYLGVGSGLSEVPKDVLSPSIIQAVARAGGRVVDHRKKGGNLWLIGIEFNGPTHKEMLRFGFKYKSGKGLYWP